MNLPTISVRGERILTEQTLTVEPVEVDVVVMVVDSVSRTTVAGGFSE